MLSATVAFKSLFKSHHQLHPVGCARLYSAKGKCRPVLLLRHKWFPSVLMLDSGANPPPLPLLLPRLPPKQTLPRCTSTEVRSCDRYTVYTLVMSALSIAVWLPFGIHYLHLSFWIRQPPQTLLKINMCLSASCVLKCSQYCTLKVYMLSYVLLGGLEWSFFFEQSISYPLQVTAMLVAVDQQLCIWNKCRPAVFCQTKCFLAWRGNTLEQVNVSLCCVKLRIACKSWLPITRFQLNRPCVCTSLERICLWEFVEWHVLVSVRCWWICFHILLNSSVGFPYFVAWSATAKQSVTSARLCHWLETGNEVV